MTASDESLSELRRAFSHFATGVTVVTTVDAVGTRIGMTVNSFSSLSLVPPLALWSLAKSSANHAAFCAASHFAIHVLDAQQSALAKHFSARSVDRFADIDTRRGLGGVPLLEFFHACFECEMRACHEGGDHTIIVGSVVRTHERPGDPLLFYRGRFSVATPLQSVVVGKLE
jgi:3-hydroxy-9,10-secoandrosta-1,3,5(10)-triene-9,17-dione monooxygenase reductase component